MRFSVILLLACALFSSAAVAQSPIPYPITQVVGNNVSSLIIKATGANLYAVYATNLTTNAGFLIIVNSATVPATGALTAATVLDCIPLQASDVSSLTYSPGPAAPYLAGVVALVSSSSGTSACTTFTTGSITAYIHGIAQ